MPILTAFDVSTRLGSADEGSRLEVEPWREDSLDENGSVRLHLGGEWFCRNRVIVEPTLEIFPSEFALAVTNEYVSLPNDLLAWLQSSATLNRLGLSVNTASVVDPRFQGRLVLELVNHGQRTMSLMESMFVATLCFSTATGDLPTHWRPQEDDGQRKTVVGRLFLEPLERELFAHLSRRPEHLFDLSPRRFEEVIAELLRQLGYDVHLTPKTKDGGRDILAYLASPIGTILTLVECKRFKPERKVGIELVERFLWVVDRNDKAACGLYVTTSSFTAGVYGLQRQHAWRLFLRDFTGLQEWMRQVAKIDAPKDGGLWIPR